MARRLAALTWEELSVRAAAAVARDPINGPATAQSHLRLFGLPEASVRVTLYRDNHAWCPYCQKVWLWLEEKRVPFRIEKVTMFCYGEKEAWYKRIVPSGMLPALELDGRVVTESDVILGELERAFGPLGQGLTDRAVVPLRRLERQLFSAWCGWLCYPNRPAEEEHAAAAFLQVVTLVEQALSTTPGGYFLEEFSTADVVFTPYIERMSASLFYYKGYVLRDPERNPHISAWFDAMEERETYRGTQSDFHTHSHDLPPQMGGCYENGSAEQQEARELVDCGPFGDGRIPDVRFAEPEGVAEEAIARTVRHREKLIAANTLKDKSVVDEALRCALTALATGEPVVPPAGGDVALRYIRDRVNVPRDMSIYAGRRMRQALEETAALAGTGQGPSIPVRHRKDQDPRAFRPSGDRAAGA